jgi:hypothetical protein
MEYCCALGLCAYTCLVEHLTELLDTYPESNASNNGRDALDLLRQLQRWVWLQSHRHMQACMPLLTIGIGCRLVVCAWGDMVLQLGTVPSVCSLKLAAHCCT